MKFKNLILAGLALVSMAACSNEKDPQVTTSENVDTYMKLVLTGAGENLSRVDSHAEDVLGDENEYLISDLNIYLCKGNKVKYVYTVKGTDLIDSSEGKETEPIKTVTGTYQVYVIANAGEAGLSINSDESSDTGTDLSTLLIENVSQKTMKENYALNKNFVMFNESKGLTFTPQEINITDNNDYERPATLAHPISLERLAVKIATNPAPTVNIDGLNSTKGDLQGKFNNVTFKGFKLLNGVGKVNLRQNWLFNMDDLGVFGNRLNTLVTPAPQTYYNKFTELAEIKTEEENPKKYLTAKNNYHKITDYGASAKDPVYCMENNSCLNVSTGAVAKKGNTTGVIFQFQATLSDDIADKQDLGDEVALGHDTFYWHNGKYYATLKAIQAANPSVFNGNKAQENTPKGHLAQAIKELTDAMNEEPGEARETALSTFRTTYMIKVFDQGIMYYTHFITDKNYKQLLPDQVLNEGEHVGYVPSILRNNIYTLNVTKLLRIGNDIPGGWNPESNEDEPVNPINVYMQVEVKVNPWTSQGQDVELK